MRKIRRLLVVLLAITMVCAMAMVANAAGAVNYDVTQGSAAKTVTVPAAVDGTAGVNYMNCFGAAGCTVTVTGVAGVTVSNADTEQTFTEAQVGEKFSFVLVENGQWGNCQIVLSNSNFNEVTVPVEIHVHAWEETNHTAEGLTSYKCSCGETKTEQLAAPVHAPGEAVKENEVAATCAVPGSYESVTYCSVCQSEVSRETVQIPVQEHTPGEAVKENEVAATCTAAGSYESVVSCTVCLGEVSREKVMVDQLPHTESTPVVENEVAATCGADGSYDSVVYCEACKSEISRQTVKVGALGHTWDNGTAVAATCTAEGKVTYKCACGETAEEVLAPKGHTAAAAVKENQVNPSTTAPGSYEEVVYCSVCKAQISRVTVEIPMVETPPMGDLTPVAVLIAAAVLSALGVAAVIIFKRKSV